MKRRRAKWRWIKWRTEHLDVRPLRLRDALGLYRCMEDPALRQFMYNASRPTLWDAFGFCAKAKWKMWRREAAYYARFFRPTGRLVSIAAVFNMNPYDPYSAEQGLWWVKDMWGKPERKEINNGIFTVFIRQEIGVERIVSRIDERNTHVLKAMRKARARFECVCRDERFDGEQHWDTYQWGLVGRNEATERAIAEALYRFGWPPEYPGKPLPEEPVTPAL